jgi:cellulose 1,4-beta-cellobiosidase
MVKIGVFGALLGSVGAQQAGTLNENYHMPISLGECDKSGCKTAESKLTLDANWRWTHKVGQPVNCYTGEDWDTGTCPDGKTCAKNCAAGAVPKEQWNGTYGISPENKGDALGVKMGFVTQGPYSKNVGSRTYLMEGDEYKLFSMLNKEISFHIDMSNMPCGTNGAIYFAEMDKTGNKGGDNAAGAPYGTGYCDGQCARDLKWVNGKANVKGWVPNKDDPYDNCGTGDMGACCAEMDLWEGNMISSAFTAHPAVNPGLVVCDTDKECGSQTGDRYIAPVDRDGCDINDFRLGNPSFYGPGSKFTLDTKKPFTFVTQFHAPDGELEEITQYYIQDGKRIENEHSIAQKWCSAQKVKFGDRDSFTEKGGLKKIGEALKRGMVLVMSMWDDIAFDMNWLDSYDTKLDPSKPGVRRGTCDPKDGDAKTLREKHPDSDYTITHLKWGDIGTTHPSHHSSEMVV